MITWKPSALQKLITDAGITKVNLSSSLEVSRPTIDKWLNGEAAPKGRFLIALSRFFEVKPDIFFTEGTAVLSVMHRTVRKTKVQDEMTDSAKALASEYETFFRNAPDPLISNTLKISTYDNNNVMRVANYLRDVAEVPEGAPVKFKNVLNICRELQISTIFRDFDKSIKSYAFFVTIGLHRVIFINSNSKPIDVVYALLHEIVHAINDSDPHREATDEEEVFCDNVAAMAQLPEQYILSLYEALRKEKNVGNRVNFLKRMCLQNHHSLFGIKKELKKVSSRLNLGNLDGASANLSKKLSTISMTFEKLETADELIEKLNNISPHFIDIAKEVCPNMSQRKVAEIFGLPTQEDGAELKIALANIDDWTF